MADKQEVIQNIFADDMKGVIDALQLFRNKKSLTKQDLETFKTHVNEYHLLRKRVETGTAAYHEMEYDSVAQKWIVRG